VIAFFEGVENFKLYLWVRVFNQFFENVEGYDLITMSLPDCFVYPSQ
jgi:hypothetical protein